MRFTLLQHVQRRILCPRQMIVTDDAILGGEPVFRKSRLAVRHVGGMLLRGASLDEIREDYSYLTDEEIELASLFALFHSCVGCPRGQFELEP